MKTLRRWYDAWRRSRLGTRLALGLGALALVVFAVVGTVMVGIMKGYLDDRLDEQLAKTQISQVPSLRTTHGGKPQQAYGWFSAVFSVRNGEASPQSGGSLPPDTKALAKVAEDATQTEVLRTVYIEDKGTFRVRACPIEPSRNIVLVSAAPQADLDRTVSQLVMVEVVAFLLALAVLVIAGRLVLRRGLRPLSDMAGTAHDIASHDLTANADLPVRARGNGGGAEVEELRTAFNVMLAHLDSSLVARTKANERLRRFIADASHELRTPLTSIRGYAELFRYAAANEPAEREAHLAKIRVETERMSVLVDDLLLLARLDAPETEAPLRLVDVDLAELIADAGEAFAAGRPEYPLTLGELPEDVVLQADPVRLRQVLDNLLANAAVHTPPGTAITLSASASPSDVFLRVTDAGPGIPPEARDRIFDRFYRVDTARTRENGGTGLGLSVVLSLVSAHGGTIDVASVPGETTFTVRLPRQRS
ncbi:HAMP domain-containing sensor histidine kinase [Amycolatopsis sp. NPDC051071]|uniref:sensor histidine kinase n=1 Tax=Amycolatopsis sp. NPDC051071 TaxID=3154637 RepID=UPI00342F146E